MTTVLSKGGKRYNEEIYDSPGIKGIGSLNVQQHITYNKRPGAAQMSGHLYEIYISMYLLLQGKKLCDENKMKDFLLATNMQEAGDLDDVVFSYNYADQSGEEKTKVIFLQAKHRDNPQKNVITLDKLLSGGCKKDYHLKTYFNAYRNIKESFKKLKAHPIFGSKFQEYELVLFTNTASIFSDCDQDIEKLEVSENDILNTGKSNYYYKVRLGGMNDKRIRDSLSNLSDYKMLAKMLAECFSSECLNVSNGIMKVYHKKLAEEVIEVREGGKGKLRESFLNPENEDPFKQMLLDEIQNSEEFARHSREDVISHLAAKNLKLPKNFGSVGDKDECPTISNQVVCDEEIEYFLNRFKIFVNQPNEKELSETIKKEIQAKFAVDDSDVNRVFSETKTNVENWWKDENHFLTKDNKFYEESARVSIWFDVRDPVELFTGRQEELFKLHGAMQRNPENNKITIISQTTSISGLGGIGKSELARKYIQQYSSDYDGNIVWINAENYVTLCESFRRLAQNNLRICTETTEGKPRDIQTIVKEVYHFFSKRRSLFVFDNAQKYRSGRDEDEGIAQFMPSLPLKTNKPYILITSRNRNWGNIEVLSLTPFTEEEATDFIRNALHFLEEPEETEIKTLAETLHYFPLALQQAVAYIRKANNKLQTVGSRFGIRDYIVRYERETEKLLNYIFPDESSDLYTRTTFTTWTITTDKIQENAEYGEQAIMVLRIIAYLSENSIPVEILRKIGELEIKDELLGNVLYELQQHSMIDVTEGLVNVHKLVQEVTRINTRKEGKEFDILSKAFQLLKSRAQSCSDTIDDAARMRRLLPHFETFLTHIDTWIHKENQHHENLERMYVEYLLTEMERMYETTGNPRRQEELLLRVLTIQETYLEPDDPKIADTLLNLSNSYGNLGEPLKQKKILEGALQILKKHYGLDHLKVAPCLENLGNAYGVLGKHMEQKILLERALEIQEKYYGPDHYRVAIYLQNLGNAYGQLGKHVEKKTFLERALQIKEKHYGPDHFRVAISLQNLGNTYGDLGKPLEQIKLLERALQIIEKHYGPDHFEVATCLGNLANTHGVLGKHLEQKKLLERALEIQENYYSPDHFRVAICLANLGDAYGDLGKHLKQKELLERAFPVLEKHYGPDHSIVAICLENLGNAYGHLGKPLERKNLLERALIILKKHYGPDHFQVAICLENLANAYGDLGKHLDRKELHESALQIKEKYYGPDHFRVAISLQNLGNAYGDLGVHLEQKNLVEKALIILKKHFGPDHFQVGICLENLGNAYGHLGKPLKKKNLHECALQILENHYGPDHFRVGICLENLGNAYGDLGEHLEQKKLLERALQILEKHYGRDHCKVSRCLVNLGNACRALGEHPEQKKLLEKAL